jgi:hypothetical protein
VSAGACTTLGCGSLATVLDTSTQRAASWFRVEPNGRPSDARWFCSIVCVAAAAGAETERVVRTALVAELTAAAAKVAAEFPRDLQMMGRRHGLEVARRIVSPDGPAEGEPHCYLCGCTEADACAGGCQWIPDASGMRDMCSTCAPQETIACGTPGCGTDQDLDAGDPLVWGWIRMEVAGTEDGPRWYCNPWCVDAAIARAAAELGSADEIVSEAIAEVPR